MTSNIDTKRVHKVSESFGQQVGYNPTLILSVARMELDTVIIHRVTFPCNQNNGLQSLCERYLLPSPLSLLDVLQSGGWRHKSNVTVVCFEIY